MSSSQGPLKNIVVSAWGPSGTVQASATTDVTGFYVMPVSAGTYRLLAYDPHGAWATTFDGNAESFDTTPTLTLGGSMVVTRNFVMLQAGTIRGTVRAGGTSKPGITIAAYNLSGTLRGSTESGSAGQYSMALPPGRFKLAAWDNNRVLATIFYPSSPSFDDATILNVASGVTLSSRDFSMGRFARMSGTITDQETDLPLGGIMAYAYTPDGGWTASATTSSDGTFGFQVPAGTYRLLAADPAGTHATAYYEGATTFLRTPLVSVDSGDSVEGLDFAMPWGGEVVGMVRTAGGTSLPGAHVVGYNPDGTPRAETTATASGDYRIILPPGSFRIASFDTGLVYAAQFYEETPIFDVASLIDVESGFSVPGVNFALPLAGRVTGVVRDATTRAPLQGIQVSAWDDEGYQIASTATDSAGGYTIAIAPGSYRFIAYDPASAYANGFDGGASDWESTGERTVFAGVSQAANFNVTQGVLLKGRCATTDGSPVGGIEISALDVEGDHVARTVSQDDGTFQLPLAPASYKLATHDSEGRYPDLFFGGAQDFSQATIIEIEQGSTPDQVTIVVGSPRGRRHGVRRP